MLLVGHFRKLLRARAGQRGCWVVQFCMYLLYFREYLLKSLPLLRPLLELKRERWMEGGIERIKRRAIQKRKEKRKDIGDIFQRRMGMSELG